MKIRGKIFLCRRKIATTKEEKAAPMLVWMFIFRNQNTSNRNKGFVYEFHLQEISNHWITSSKGKHTAYTSDDYLDFLS